MLISLRACVVFLALALILSGFVFACPQFTSDMGLDVWNSYADEQELKDGLKRRAELDEISERVNQRLSLKLIVVRDLIDGRISLAHATEDFTTLNRIEPGIMGVTRASYPADSDDESVALQVLSFANANLADYPSQGREVSHRLAREMDEMKASRSTDLR